MIGQQNAMDGAVRKMLLGFAADYDARFAVQAVEAIGSHCSVDWGETSCGLQFGHQVSNFAVTVILAAVAVAGMFDHFGEQQLTN